MHGDVRQVRQFGKTSVFRTLLSTIAASLIVATPVLAQSGPSPIPAEIAAARSESVRIITTADAGDVFDDVTTSDLPTARHIPSGLHCIFIGDQSLDRLTVIPSSAGTGSRRGNDVACSSLIGDIELTLYITRYADDHSADEDLQMAVAAIANRFPELVPHEGDLTIHSATDGLPLWAAFDVTVDGRELMTFVAVNKIDAWMVKIRATGPRQDADSVSTLASLLLMRAEPTDPQ